MLNNLLSRFKSLDRKMKIAVISAIVVGCCIIPYIAVSLTPTSDIEETPTLPPDQFAEKVIVQNTSTPEPTEIPTDTPIPSPTPTAISFTLPESAQCLEPLTYIGDAVVSQIIDGDTIEINLAGSSESVPVRYIGIDSPERDEEYFTEANDFNSGLVQDKKVHLFRDVSEKDQFDRYLYYVIVENQFVNYELVKSGWASAVEYPPDTGCAESLYAAENQAIQEKSGFWAALVPGAPEQPPATLAPTSPGTESQPGDIVIVRIFYDGVVSRQEPDEYVEIKNNGSASINLSGWLLHDEGNKHRFVFPGYELAPGESCRIYTNENHPEHCGFNFGFGGSAIWNNSGDCAFLYDSNGNHVTQKCY